MGSSIVDSKAGTDYKAVLDEYNSLQKQAYTTSDVSETQVTALKTKLADYVDSHVNDSEKSSITGKLTADLDTMMTAVKLKNEQGTRSDKEWDTVREDLEGLLTSLASDPSDAEQMFKPGSTSLTADTGTALYATTASSDASLESYLQQHPAARKYAAMAEAAGKKQNPPIPARVLLSQIDAESSFNPNAVGRGGEQGLSQFTTETWKAYGQGGNPNNPQDAINAQANYMADLIKQNNGSIERALMSYNGWDFSKSFDWNTDGKQKYPPSSKTYVQDITGQPFDQSKI